MLKVTQKKRLKQAFEGPVCGVVESGPWLGAEEGSDLRPIVPTFVRPLELAHCLQFAPRGAGEQGGKITHHTPTFASVPQTSEGWGPQALTQLLTHPSDKLSPSASSGLDPVLGPSWEQGLVP